MSKKLSPPKRAGGIESPSVRKKTPTRTEEKKRMKPEPPPTSSVPPSSSSSSSSSLRESKLPPPSAENRRDPHDNASDWRTYSVGGDSTRKSTKKPEQLEKQAEENLRLLPVSVTGARGGDGTDPGDIIEGHGGSAGGAQYQLTAESASLPPYRPPVEYLLEHRRLREPYLTKLAGLRYFAALTAALPTPPQKRAAIEAWLRRNWIAHEALFRDIRSERRDPATGAVLATKRVALRVHSLGTNAFERGLSDEAKDRVMSPPPADGKGGVDEQKNGIDATALQQLYPPAAKGVRNTLAFLFGNWTVATTYETPDEFAGLVVNGLTPADAPTSSSSSLSPSSPSSLRTPEDAGVDPLTPFVEPKRGETAVRRGPGQVLYVLHKVERRPTQKEAAADAKAAETARRRVAEEDEEDGGGGGGGSSPTKKRSRAKKSGGDGGGGGGEENAAPKRYVAGGVAVLVEASDFVWTKDSLLEIADALYPEVPLRLTAQLRATFDRLSEYASDGFLKSYLQKSVRFPASFATFPGDLSTDPDDLAAYQAAMRLHAEEERKWQQRQRQHREEQQRRHRQQQQSTGGGGGNQGEADEEEEEQKGADRRPLPPQMPLQKYPLPYARTVAVVYLMLRPGVLVPDIHAYVTGKESAYKRTVVSAFEDAGYRGRGTRDRQLFAAAARRLAVQAFVGQRVHAYRPSRAAVRDFFATLRLLTIDLCHYAYRLPAKDDAERRRRLTQGVRDPPRCYVERGTSNMQLIAALVTDLKSFAGDLYLLNDLAARPELLERPVKHDAYRRPAVLDVTHTVDQHWATELAYFFEPEFYRDLEVSRRGPSSSAASSSSSALSVSSSSSSSRVAPPPGRSDTSRKRGRASPIVIDDSSDDGGEESKEEKKRAAQEPPSSDSDTVTDDESESSSDGGGGAGGTEKKKREKKEKVQKSGAVRAPSLKKQEAPPPPVDVETSRRDKQSAAFRGVFDLVFELVSGANPSKQEWRPDFDTRDPTVRQIRRAQRAYWRALSTRQVPTRAALPDTRDTPHVRFRYSVDPAWFAGLVGSRAATVPVSANVDLGGDADDGDESERAETSEGEKKSVASSSSSSASSSKKAKKTPKKKASSKKGGGGKKSTRTKSGGGGGGRESEEDEKSGEEEETEKTASEKRRSPAAAAAPRAQKKAVNVMMVADHIEQWTAVSNPARSKKAALELSESERETAIAAVQDEMASAGLTMSAAAPPIAAWRGARAYYDRERAEYWVRLDPKRAGQVYDVAAGGGAGEPDAAEAQAEAADSGDEAPGQAATTATTKKERARAAAAARAKAKRKAATADARAEAKRGARAETKEEKRRGAETEAAEAGEGGDQRPPPPPPPTGRNAKDRPSRFDDGRHVAWETLRHLALDYPLLEYTDADTLEELLANARNEVPGVTRYAQTAWRRFLAATPADELQEALNVLTPVYRREIRMPQLSRSGGGADSTVTLAVVGAYRVLLRVAVYFPAALSMRAHHPLHFSVPSGPLLWDVVEQLRAHLWARSVDRGLEPAPAVPVSSSFPPSVSSSSSAPLAAPPTDSPHFTPFVRAPLPVAPTVAYDPKRRDPVWGDQFRELGAVDAARLAEQLGDPDRNKRRSNNKPGAGSSSSSTTTTSRKQARSRTAEREEEEEGERETRRDVKRRRQEHIEAPPPSSSVSYDRVPFAYQSSILERMIERNAHRKKGHFVWLGVGLGKTYTLCAFLRHLLRTGRLPPYVVYTLPETALRSVAAELAHFNIAYERLDPTGRGKDAPPLEMRPGRFYLVTHDHVRHPAVRPLLFRHIGDTFFAVDEVHECMAPKTQRTTNMLALARLSRDFAALTGTPAVDKGFLNLAKWIELIVEFAVTARNFWVAVSSMLKESVKTYVEVFFERTERRPAAATAPFWSLAGGDAQLADAFAARPHTQLTTPPVAGVIELHRTTVNIADGEAWSSPEAYAEYERLLPTRAGGTNRITTDDEYRRAAKLCYDEASEFMARDALEFLARGSRGVFVVARNDLHQHRLRHLLLAAARTRLAAERALTPSGDPQPQLLLAADQIIMIGPDGSVHLTADEVAAGGGGNEQARARLRRCRCVITTVARNSGYSVTLFDVMLTAEYPSSAARREQLAGRLVRKGQRSKIVRFFNYVPGILRNIQRRHTKAETLQAALKLVGAERESIVRGRSTPPSSKSTASSSSARSSRVVK